MDWPIKLQELQQQTDGSTIKQQDPDPECGKMKMEIVFELGQESRWCDNNTISQV